MHEILLFDEIGMWGITAKEVVTQLQAAGDEPVLLRVNSPGGDVYEGIAIMNALRGHKGEVTAVVEGMAASAASFIIAGGATKVIARPEAEIMVHDAWAFSEGNADDLGKVVSDLDRMSAKLAEIYAAKSGGSADEWRDIMRAETWFTAEEALAAGLVDSVEDALALEPVALARAGGTRRMLARFKYTGRGEAPDPFFHARNRVEEENMSFLEKLAGELGREPGVVKAALERFMNETVEVPATELVTYPDEVTVVPTGKVTITPEGDVPDGVVVTATVPDGWVAEVGDLGAVTVTAPDTVAVDDTVDVVLSLDGGQGPAEVTVKVTVVAAADDGGDAASSEPVPQAPGVVTLDQDTYNELVASAALGREAFEAQAKAKRVAEVEAWVRDGRISAGVKQKALALAETDMDAARRLYGSNPKNTIPRREIGYAFDAKAEEEVEADGVPSVKALMQRAAKRAAKSK